MNKMDEFPSSYEQFLKVHKRTVSEVSESEFYKEGYLSIVVLLESSMQKLHTLESTNQNLMDENKRLEREIDTHIEEIGDAEIQLKEMKKKNEKLKNEVEDTVAENNCLKLKITTLEEESEKLKKQNEKSKNAIENKVSENDYLKTTIAKLEDESRKMVTINQIEELLDTKLAKLENSIVKGLNPIVVTSDESQQERCETVTNNNKNRNAATPILRPPTDFPSTTKLLSSAAPSFPVQSLKECTDLQLRQCTEWWCPVHSDFRVLVKKVKPTSANDQILIQRAKSRFAYWTRENTVRCCTLDRKRQTEPIKYELPSCWPTVLASDLDELSNAFSKF